MTRTVQEHYDLLDGEFEDGVEVNMLSVSHVELDLGDSHPVDTLATAVDRASTVLDRIGYTLTEDPVVEAGYRGAHDQALLVQIPIAENPYEDSIDTVVQSTNNE